ncbi:hypothetical protein [Bordetella bronchiseptica]|uniref:hypothetical protein n=1 Tax=Bordetella bronchiseptica TaxID=518 RepID=UPI000FDBB7A8|nr:hypothetical protein [Bordetella bronchiseptica]
MKPEIKIGGLDGVLATLKKLPPEIVSKRGGPARAALRKGAMEIVKQARVNFKAAVAEAGKSGITQSTGFTERNIVAIRKSPRNGERGERYIVSVRYVAHPNAQKIRRKSRRVKKNRRPRDRKSRVLQANDVAFMMEWGTSKQPATPWLRPAFQSKAKIAIDVMSADLVRRVDQIVKKLATQNRGR